MIPYFDFRLLDIWLEIAALEDQLELIENQLDDLSRQERIALEAKLQAEDLDPNVPPGVWAAEDYQMRVHILLPRILRGPFLISLYAVYESAVAEIAILIWKKGGSSEKLEPRRDFLGTARRFFRRLDVELCPSQEEWKRIRMVETIRHALAHSNGRCDAMAPEKLAKIKGWQNAGYGLRVETGYLLVEGDFLRESFELVSQSLKALLGRYRQWDDVQPAE